MHQKHKIEHLDDDPPDRLRNGCFPEQLLEQFRNASCAQDFDEKYDWIHARDEVPVKRINVL